MNKIGISATLASLLLLAACVTINIYFPAAAAEKAAERIVDEIIGPENGQPAAGDKGSALDEGWPTLARAGGAVLDFLIPPARAAEPDFNVDTPAIRRLQAGMKQRHDELEPYYASGAVGFANDGLVELRDAAAVPLKDRNKVKKLVADENQDRNALYREIAGANGHPEWEGDVRATFAKTWVDKARSGWWYKIPGGWKRK